MMEKESPLFGNSAELDLTYALGNKSDLDIRDIFDALPFYVLLVDENHYILEANSAVYEQFGVKREDILGKYCPMVIHGLNHPFPGCPLEEAAKINQAVERTYLMRSLDAGSRPQFIPLRALLAITKESFSI